MALHLIEPGNMLAGNLLDDDAEIHVVPVNCVGVMGKGLALAYKQLYPECEELYRAACKHGMIRPGHPYMPTVDYAPTLSRDGRPGRLLCHFPTKRHWRDPSRLVDIYLGLANLTEKLQDSRHRSIAFPALGCGLGGLYWRDVWGHLADFAEFNPHMEVRFYTPKGQ